MLDPEADGRACRGRFLRGRPSLYRPPAQQGSDVASLKNRLGRSPDRADAVVLAFSGWAPRKARSTEVVHWG